MLMLIISKCYNINIFSWTRIAHGKACSSKKIFESSLDAYSLCPRSAQKLASTSAGGETMEVIEIFNILLSILTFNKMWQEMEIWGTTDMKLWSMFFIISPDSGYSYIDYQRPVTVNFFSLALGGGGGGARRNLSFTSLPGGIQFNAIAVLVYM